MAKLFIPPPSPMDLLDHIAHWIARAYQVKVTVTIAKSDRIYNTSEYDYLVKPAAIRGK